MKKVVLSAAALMIGAVSFAQTGNTSTVKQNGNNGYSDVDQVGYTLISTVYQEGDHNSARVNQQAKLNTAIITQVGDRNNASTQQNTDHPVGSGDGNNTSSQEQYGDYNSASVIQDVTGWDHSNGTSDSEAQQVQSGSENYASIEQAGLNLRSHQTQIGNSNVAIDWQGGGHHDSDVYQEGDHNSSNVYQRRSTNKSGVIQVGDRNFSDVDQNGWKHDSSVSQYGNYNISVVNQSTYGFSPNINHTSTVVQNGHGNSSNVLQNMGAPVKLTK